MFRDGDSELFCCVLLRFMIMCFSWCCENMMAKKASRLRNEVLLKEFRGASLREKGENQTSTYQSKGWLHTDQHVGKVTSIHLHNCVTWLLVQAFLRPAFCGSSVWHVFISFSKARSWGLSHLAQHISILWHAHVTYSDYLHTANPLGHRLIWCEGEWCC